MRKNVVCVNCREPIGGKTQKFCSDCAPHARRMREKAGRATTKWAVVSKYCHGCKRILLPQSFKTKTNGRGFKYLENVCSDCSTLIKVSRRSDERNLSPSDWSRNLAAFGGACAYCGGEWSHRDHLIPVKMGGSFSKMNIVPSCAKCNTTKRAKNPFKFDGAPQAFMKLLETHL